MTELSPVSHISPDGNKQYGAAGVLVANTEAKLVDVDTNKAVTAPGDANRGEIWIRGPQVMKGYLNNATATAGTVDKDGWLHTGDIAYYDEEGFFFVVDRLKELIKYKGFQVPPAELEGLLLEHPGLADAAVIPVPDAEADELPKAFVVRKPGAEALTEDEVKAFIKERVVHYKRLRGGVEFVEAIPKSASGKILRRVLKEQERAKRNTVGVLKSRYPDVELPEAPLVDHLLTQLQKVKDGSKVAFRDVATGREVSFAELRSNVTKAGAGLSTAGLSQGDCLLVFSPNHVDYAAQPPSAGCALRPTLPTRPASWRTSCTTAGPSSW
jgi:acyl-CoA synthetase (AMP-forming)/AMP-acid ligase II